MSDVICPRVTVGRSHGRVTAALVALLAGLLSLQVIVAPTATAADPITYQGPAFGGTGPSPTEDKPQSKLWFNDGSWWALMRTSGNGSDGNPDVTIHRLLANHTWSNTGTVVDKRSASTADTMLENGKLYVASRVPSGNITVSRLGYATATDTYTVEATANVANGSIESVTIARDGVGRLWVTYTKPLDSSRDQVWVAHSTTSDTTWAAPFLVPVADNTVAADDISAVVAFSGKVGVMWSDQQNQVIRFAVHSDSTADTRTGWTMEDAYAGTRSADDHVNLKSLLEDEAGRVYAAIKTSRGDSSTDPASSPSVVVLSRSSSGAWTPTTAATVGENLTRPQLALDSTNKHLYVVMSTESGGNVYYRRSALGSSMSFTTRATLLTWAGALINNATTAKAPVTGTSGLVVLASDEKNTKRYYHTEIALAGGTTPPADTTPPTVSTVSPASGASGVPVNTNVTATFSEAMDAATINGTNFTLKTGTTTVPAAVTYDATSRTATLNPTNDLAASTSYTATVTTGVKDANGLAMATARTWTFTTAAAGGGGGTTATVVASADSYVSAGATGTNHGTEAALVVDGSPIEITYLKFDLAAYSGKTLTGATLQVRSAGSGSTGTQNVKLVADDSWTETGLTYSNRPALGSAVGRIGPTVVNTNYNVTLTAASLQGELGQVLSLGMDSTSTDGLDLNSRETATKPTLVLTFAP